MTFRKSDHCMVPMKVAIYASGMKPGNSGAGKAVKRL